MDPFPSILTSYILEPTIPSDLKEVDLSQEAFVELLIQQVIQKRLLEKLKLWSESGIKKEREPLADEWIVMIWKLNKFLNQFVENICKSNDVIPASKLWEEITEVFLGHEAMEPFKLVIKRVFKYGLVIFRQGDVQIWRSIKSKSNLDGTDCYMYLSQVKKVLNAICEKDKLHLHNVFYEAMALAAKEVINVEVVQHSADLTSYSIFPNIAKEADFIAEYLRYFDIGFEEMEGSFKTYAIKAFIFHLTSRCYELVVELYPKTKVTLVQLMKAMKNLEWHGREKLVNSLIVEIRKRLLQTGVSTKQILKSYANVVESLTFFDSSFVLVHRVCNVIKDYVISRPDTIKTIIKFITIERPGENSSNYCNLIFSENQLAAVNDEYVLAIEETANNSWSKWKPDPHDANPYESRLFRKSADVFSMLVMIYGSKEMFVKEYHEFLAARLVLNGWRRRFKEELSYVEMMKNRFHEGELTQCEVMLKDIQDSETFCKDLNSWDVRIISKEYWPSQDDKKISLPESFKELRENVDKLYEFTRKNNRKLRWFNNYGCFVDLNLEFGDVNLNVEIPFHHYAIITAFLEKEKINISELSVTLGWDSQTLNEVIDWWIQQGCLISDGNFVSLNEDENVWIKFQKAAEEQQKKYQEKGDVDEDSEEEDDEGDDDGCNPRIEYMEKFWDYVRNMLKIASRPHVGQHILPVTAERLLNTFKMLSSPGKPPVNLEDVHVFMNRKVRANLVFVDNGNYKLTPEFLATLTQTS